MSLCRGILVTYAGRRWVLEAALLTPLSSSGATPRYSFTATLLANASQIKCQRSIETLGLHSLRKQERLTRSAVKHRHAPMIFFHRHALDLTKVVSSDVKTEKAPIQYERPLGLLCLIHRFNTCPAPHASTTSRHHDFFMAPTIHELR